jgi:hypothetical protein
MTFEELCDKLESHMNLRVMQVINWGTAQTIFMGVEPVVLMRSEPKANFIELSVYFVEGGLAIMRFMTSGGEAGRDRFNFVATKKAALRCPLRRLTGARRRPASAVQFRCHGNRSEQRSRGSGCRCLPRLLFFDSGKSGPGIEKRSRGGQRLRPAPNALHRAPGERRSLWRLRKTPASTAADQCCTD